MFVTTIVEITNKLLRHVSTQEVSSPGSSLVLVKLLMNVLKCASYEIKIH